MIGRTFAAWRSALAFGRSFPTTSLAKAGLIAFVGYVHFEYTHGSASEVRFLRAFWVDNGLVDAHRQRV